jgi:hypothetical protein
MGEAGLFRQYAKEAMHVASEVTSENEKRTLVDLACTWAVAALMSDRVLGSSFVSSLCDVGEAASHAPSNRALRTPNFPLRAARGRAQSCQSDGAARRM